MKRLMLFAGVLAIAASCSVKEMETASVPAPQMFGYTEDDQPTKTAITVDGEGVGTIWWKPADNINVFFETASVRYYSTNQSDATTVVFETSAMIGSTESALTNRWGLYPYNSEATCDGSSVTTTIPAAQQCVPETFGNNLFTMIAHTSSNELHFKNACGGIKFSLSRDDIQSITFRGNNNEDIVGQVQLTLDGEDNPVANVIAGEKTVTLTPSTGTTFASGTNYYLVMLPTVLAQGFTMTFETETELGTFEYTAKSIEIKRSIFAKKADIDTYANFVAKAVQPEMVDLGLSVKWASFNLGATRPEEYGDYFAWGELEPKSTYDWSNYKWCNGTYSTLTKYNFSYTYGSVCDNKATLDLEDDAAHFMLNEEWRIPTSQQWVELWKKCTFEWTTVNEIEGYLVTSNVDGFTGNSIFLPAAGMMDDNSNSTAGVNGYYWSSSHYRDDYPNKPHYANDMYFSSSSIRTGLNVGHGRALGMSIRPVSIIKVSSISFSNNPSTLYSDVRNTARISVNILPDNATIKDVIWSSSDESIARVDQLGNVTAIAPGSVEVTAESVDGGANCSCTITVEDPFVDMGLSVKWCRFNIPQCTWNEISSLTENATWRVPTRDEWRELWLHTSISNDSGWGYNCVSTVQGFEGNRIGLPYTGEDWGEDYTDYWGEYWASSSHSSNNQNGDLIYFQYGDSGSFWSFDRYDLKSATHAIRPVKNK